MSLSVAVTYPKLCANEAVYRSEVDGRDFFAGYYPDVPLILDQDGSGVVHYENVATPGVRVLTDVLAQDDYEPGSLNPAFNQLARIHRVYSEVRPASGGTQRFYLDRRTRLHNRQLKAQYDSFCRYFGQVSINGSEVVVDHLLLERARYSIGRTALSLCAPSQGDYHERNIFSNGRIIDFEAAGWNAVSTDVATFIWHTLFVGNHFGPKYAAWSGPADKEMMKSAEVKPLVVLPGTVEVRVSDSRRALINDYLDRYLDSIDLPPDESSRISQAIAFRLLSMFEPQSMERADRHAVFCLANFFLRNPGSLRSKIDILLKRDQSRSKSPL